MSVSLARPASTVVLLRPSRARFEVFLVRRHDNVAFMGGAHVFPGGRVDQADRLDQAEALCDGVPGAVARMADVPAADAIGHHVAAIRELFEEAGALLARRADGRIIGFHEPSESARFSAYRVALASGTVTLGALAEGERLRLALDELSLFAHWRTPEIEVKLAGSLVSIIKPSTKHPSRSFPSPWCATQLARRLTSVFKAWRGSGRWGCFCGSSSWVAVAQSSPPRRSRVLTGW